MYHPSQTALVLMALATLVAGGDVPLDGATYSCLPSSFPGFPDGLGSCASQTTRADCLANSWAGLTTVSCAWRATTATALVDEFYIYNVEQTGQGLFSITTLLPTNPLFTDYCALASTISVPKSAVGNYYVVGNVDLGSGVTVDSGCVVGLEGGKRDCTSIVSFPPTRANTHAPGFNFKAIIFNPVTIPGNTTRQPVLMTNVYFLPGSAQCGARRRSATRRLAQDATRPWFRAMTIDQAILGGANNNLPNLNDIFFGNCPKGVFIGQLRNVVSVKAKLMLVDNPVAAKARPGSVAATPVAKAYLITQGNFYPYFQGASCTTSCSAPTNLAVASCTVDAKGKCTFDASGLTDSTYLIVASKGTIGLNPADTPFGVRLQVDVQYSPSFDP